MKFFIKFILLLGLVLVIKTDSVSLTPYDEMQYGNYFNDKNNILTVNPEDFSSQKNNENSLKTVSSQKSIDPSFKAIMQDISENSHFLSSDSKEESNLLSENQRENYQKQIEESVNNEMNEISQMSREEGFRNQNQAMEEMYNENNFPKQNKKNGFLKPPRFLEKPSNNEEAQIVYDPTEMGII